MGVSAFACGRGISEELDPRDNPPRKARSQASPQVVGDISYHAIAFLRGVAGPAGCVEASLGVCDLPQLSQKKQGVAWVLGNSFALLAS